MVTTPVADELRRIVRTGIIDAITREALLLAFQQVVQIERRLFILDELMAQQSIQSSEINEPKLISNVESAEPATEAFCFPISQSAIDVLVWLSTRGSQSLVMIAFGTRRRREKIQQLLIQLQGGGLAESVEGSWRITNQGRQLLDDQTTSQ